MAYTEQYHLQLVVLDQTYGKGVNGDGHLNSTQVSEIIGRMMRKNIIDRRTPVFATHISHEGNDVHDNMEAAAAENGYHIAYDGLTLML